MILYYEWLFSNGEKASVYQFKGDITIEFEQDQETIEQQNSKDQTITMIDFQNFSKRNSQTPSKAKEDIVKRTVHTAPMKSGAMHKSNDTTPKKLYTIDDIDLSLKNFYRDVVEVRNNISINDVNTEKNLEPFEDKKKIDKPFKQSQFELESLFVNRDKVNKQILNTGDTAMISLSDKSLGVPERLADDNRAQKLETKSRFGLDGLFVKLGTEKKQPKKNKSIENSSSAQSNTTKEIFLKELVDRSEPNIHSRSNDNLLDISEGKISNGIKYDKSMRKIAKETVNLKETNSNSDVEIVSEVKKYSRFKTRPGQVMISKVATLKKPKKDPQVTKRRRLSDIRDDGVIGPVGKANEGYTPKPRFGRVADEFEKSGRAKDFPSIKDSSKENILSGRTASPKKNAACKKEINSQETAKSKGTIESISETIKSKETGKTTGLNITNRGQEEARNLEAEISSTHKSNMILELDKPYCFKRKAPMVDIIVEIVEKNGSGNQTTKSTENGHLSITLDERDEEICSIEDETANGSKSSAVSQRSTGFLGQIGSGIQNIIHKATSGLLGSSKTCFVDIPIISHSNSALSLNASDSSRMHFTKSGSSQIDSKNQANSLNTKRNKDSVLSKTQELTYIKPKASLKSIFKEKEMNLNDVKSIRNSLSRYLPVDTKATGGLEPSQAVFRSGEVQVELDRIFQGV